MSPAELEQLRRYVGFTEEDAGRLAALGPRIQPLLPAAIDRFYEQILAHPGTRAVLTGGSAQISRLRQTLADWLRSLFCGVYDENYWNRREAIGRTHVRVGLPQHYMVAAMQTVWYELESAVRRLELPDAPQALSSLHKLLMLELAAMLDSYKQSYSEQIRQLERQAVRERLSEAEHLARIGHLAASLAHEIKNPLAGISGAIQVIRDSMKPGEPHRPILDEVLRQVARLDGTVKDLLVYARPKPPRLRTCHLHDVIAHTIAALSQQPEMQHIRLECPNSQKLPAIVADELQLEQLLTNLLLNAAQASQPGQTVRLVVTPRPDGVRLSVEDHGHGMDEEVRRRAMEPFFTTKARGTGLGLSICRKIVDMHGGTLTIHSAVGKGTQVIVDLPSRPPDQTDGTS